jgi:hypothetical protein
VCVQCRIPVRYFSCDKLHRVPVNADEAEIRHRTEALDEDEGDRAALCIKITSSFLVTLTGFYISGGSNNVTYECIHAVAL